MIRKCQYCSKEYEGLGKYYCGYPCAQKSQKGKKMPHSKEWEESRLKAVRENSWKRKGKPNEKSKETIKIAQVALKKWQEENPEKYREQCIKDLPKDCSGEKNGNWRNGITKLMYNWRTQNYHLFKKWRKDILEKNNHTCVLCGSKEKLETHHIIPICEDKSCAFELWNGVTLCRTCHQKTDSWGGSCKNKKTCKIYAPKYNKFKIITKIIPHAFQEYDTSGNYKKIGDTIYFLISEQCNPHYTMLMFIHEIIELFIVNKQNISIDDIDKFDIEFQKTHDHSLEPGEDFNAPYHDAHMYALSVEKKLCDIVGMDFETYNNELV
jgi:5-methylcytosine-specific restriction endonuclease McrA